MFDLDRFHAEGITIADLACLARVDFTTAWRWVCRGARPSKLAQQELRCLGLWQDTAPRIAAERRQPPKPRTKKPRAKKPRARWGSILPRALDLLQHGPMRASEMDRILCVAKESVRQALCRDGGKKARRLDNFMWELVPTGEEEAP